MRGGGDGGGGGGGGMAKGYRNPLAADRRRRRAQWVSGSEDGSNSDARGDARELDE